MKSSPSAPSRTQVTGSVVPSHFCPGPSSACHGLVGVKGRWREYKGLPTLLNSLVPTCSSHGDDTSTVHPRTIIHSSPFHSPSLIHRSPKTRGPSSIHHPSITLPYPLPTAQPSIVLPSSPTIHPSAAAFCGHCTHSQRGCSAPTFRNHPPPQCSSIFLLSAGVWKGLAWY